MISLYPMKTPAIVSTQAAAQISSEQINRSVISCDVDTIRLWQAIENDLLEIKSLESDWDGFGSPPASGTVWNEAYRFLKLFRAQDTSLVPQRVALSPDGTIGFEWVKGKNYIRAEITSASVQWAFAAEGKPTKVVIEPLEDTAASREQTWQPAPDAVGAHDLAYAI